jgi:hypothetical protein
MVGHVIERSHTIRVLLSICLSMSMMSVLGTSAVAARATSRAYPVAAVAVAMRLDCKNMSRQVHAYAQAHGYCTPTSTPGTAAPYSTTSGDCGSSWLTVWNEGNGVAEFSYGFQSTVGNVIYRSLIINWTNWSRNRSSSFGDASWMNNAYYNTTRNVYTGSGWVTGAMGGWVELWWGGQCDIVPPSDGDTIT